MTVRSPKLWSPDSPELYRRKSKSSRRTRLLDKTSARFGIRKIEVDAEHGFRLNGQPLKLKGGCLHHDNGPLGSAAIDRAEERRVELMKANGFNAIRTSHNPPSPAFLDACDRLGMLVIDEAFDCWDEAKNGQDYHLYFNEWSERDIASMVRRDRNHPSVVMWSIGNEIPRAVPAPRRPQRSCARRCSRTTPPARSPRRSARTGAMSSKNWDKLSDVAFRYLDVGGYNYLRDKYESDHARNPKRVMMGTESYPQGLLRELGARGEASLRHRRLRLDGDGLLRRIRHRARHAEQREGRLPHAVAVVSTPGAATSTCADSRSRSPSTATWSGGAARSKWPFTRRCPRACRNASAAGAGRTRQRSWTWPGQEGKPMQVTVYSRCDSVRLELNGKVIGEEAGFRGDRS